MGCKTLMAFAVLSAAALAFAAPTKYEAEEQAGVTAADITTDDEGAKYVKPADAAGMTFTVKVEETAVYDITAKVRIKIYDWITSKIVVNGVDVGSMLTTPRNVDSSYVIAASAKMKVGENQITVGNQSIGVDYITVERHPDPEYKISASPVTPNASESARKLYGFLRDNFGKKTISGMMISDQNFNYNYGDMKIIPPGGCTPADSCKYTDEEVSWKGQTDIAEFYKRSGHYPAIGGFDMLFAAGGHHEEGWFRGYTENNLLMTEDLWTMGGIPTYTWHWKVGEDTVFYTKDTYPMNGFNASGCTEGVKGTSESNTCFNYTKAFKGDKCAEIDETSQEYKDIVADVDIVSGYFKQLQDKGIAVVWRPLHEASGGWFWWGTASAECYVQLYRLVFKRMVETNKLNNLIWVWNINTDPALGYDYSALNAAWYPGDEYVDIVAVDIYDPLNDHNSAANYYNKIVSDVGTSKMIALSENGAIPDIDSIAEDKAYWSYWMTWSQTWSGNFLEKTPADMWKRNLDDERIIALDNMPGWDKVSAIGSEGTTRAFKQISNKLSITLQGNNLSITIPQAGHTSIALFDMLGHKVAHLAKGNLPAGTLQFSLDGIASGNYIVRAKNGTAGYAQRIRVK
ncbi:glycosyl hydrolase [Fibrobacter succinogenes]|uniref:glycosyl hydrolase n=1 Tax=Fibrobacter succinogenes TaxID=833 RepID=UPI0013D21249|nr:glycosyl hydrolase [Fibrobacter succinogenes]